MKIEKFYGLYHESKGKPFAYYRDVEVAKEELLKRHASSGCEDVHYHIECFVGVYIDATNAIVLGSYEDAVEVQ